LPERPGKFSFGFSESFLAFTRDLHDAGTLRAWQMRGSSLGDLDTILFKLHDGAFELAAV
jgi:hypothetical protein